ncbi:MAG: signal peptidase II [Candidatus Saccharibacteria bacterium]
MSRAVPKIIVLILIDQITKLLLAPRDFSFLFFRIRQIANAGLSFGLTFANPVSLVIVAGCLLLLAIQFLKNPPRTAVQNWGTILVLAGGISNILDRLFRGFVLDFVDVGLGFTFNLADCMIFAGLVALLLPITREAWKK